MKHLPIFVWLMLTSIGLCDSGEAKLRDGDTITLDITAKKGQKTVAVSFDNASFVLPVHHPENIPDDEVIPIKNVPKSIFERLGDEFTKKQALAEAALNVEGNAMVVQPNAPFFEESERLDVPKLKRELWSHAKTIYDSVDMHQKDKNLGAVIEETKYIEPWVDSTINESVKQWNKDLYFQKKFDIKRVLLLKQVVNKMFREMRDDYNSANPDFNKTKSYLKAVRKLIDNMDYKQVI